MKNITVEYLGKMYNLTYYATTLNVENIYFVITEDEDAIKLLVLNHFFIPVDIKGSGQYYFNAIGPTGEEADFKEQISLQILMNEALRG